MKVADISLRPHTVAHIHQFALRLANKRAVGQPHSGEGEKSVWGSVYQLPRLGLLGAWPPGKLTELGVAVINKRWTLSRLPRSPGLLLPQLQRCGVCGKKGRKIKKVFLFCPHHPKPLCHCLKLMQFCLENPVFWAFFWLNHPHPADYINLNYWWALDLPLRKNLKWKMLSKYLEIFHWDKWPQSSW